MTMAKPRRRPSSSSSFGDEDAPQACEEDEPDISSYIPSYLRRMVIPHHGEFCVSAIFHPQLLAQLMAEGFLPMAVQTSSARNGSRNPREQRSASYLLLPKLHTKRSVVPLNPQCALHVSRSVRKKAKHYSLTLNTSWNKVVEFCRQQHGLSCWLYPPLVEAYAAIHEQPMEATVTQAPPVRESASPRLRPATVLVRMYSVELWDNRTQELVAGELGYTVGGFMYTSLTGFTRQDSAGSVQLAAWGRYLQQKQFAVWDLGMDMEYKRQLGAQEWPRRDFINFVRTQSALAVSPIGANSPLLGSVQQQPISCQQILQHGEATPGVQSSIPATKEDGVEQDNAVTASPKKRSKTSSSTTATAASPAR